MGKRRGTRGLKLVFFLLSAGIMVSQAGCLLVAAGAADLASRAIWTVNGLAPDVAEVPRWQWLLLSGLGSGIAIGLITVLATRRDPVLA